MISCDLIMKGSYLLTMDNADNRYKDGAVAISDGKILGVGRTADIEAKYQAKQTIYHEHSVIIPGLINGHTHQTLTRGLHEDLPLMRWLEEVCYPIESSYVTEDAKAASLMVQAEFIKGGVTLFADLFRFINVAAETAAETGIRALLAPQFFDVTMDTLESIDQTIGLIEKYNGSADGRVNIWFGPHSPYSVNEENYAKAAETARKMGVGIHTHLCETEVELSIVRERYGKDPVQMMEDAGVLDTPCVLAHGIYLTDDNIKLLGEKAGTAAVIYNPISNLKLADGIAPIPKLKAAGCVIGLGTDSNLSNNGFDMFNEMRIGSYMQKTKNRDPSLCSCYEMLQMSTRGNAAALKMDDKIGSLEAGKLADVIMIDFNSPHLWPVYYENPSNIVEQIVYSARAADVITTVVNGRVLMDDRKLLTIDTKQVFDLVQRCSHDLYARSFPDRI